VRDMKGMNASQLAQERAQAALRLYMEDLQNKQRDKELADRKTDDEKAATLGSVTALTQGISREAGDIEALQKSIRNDIGALGSEKEEEKTQAIGRLASALGEDPTALRAADPAVIEAKAAEFVAKKNERMQALSTLSDKIALKTASKKAFSDEEKQTLTAVREQLQPNSSLKVGELKAVPATGIMDISSVVKTDPALSAVFSAYLKKKSDTGFFSADPEAIDILQEKVMNPDKGIQSLTLEEMKKLSEYKDEKSGKTLVQEFMAIPVKQFGGKTVGAQYKSLLDTAVKAKDIKTLKRLAPKSEIGVAGFGE
jgi:hypothetical protein